VVYESAKWLGKCPSCGSWNTFVQEVIHKETSQKENNWKDFNEDKKNLKQIPLHAVTTPNKKGSSPLM